MVPASEAGPSTVADKASTNCGHPLGITGLEDKCSPYKQTTEILGKMYIVTCLVHGF